MTTNDTKEWLWSSPVTISTFIWVFWISILTHRISLFIRQIHSWTIMIHTDKKGYINYTKNHQRSFLEPYGDYYMFIWRLFFIPMKCYLLWIPENVLNILTMVLYLVHLVLVCLISGTILKLYIHWRGIVQGLYIYVRIFQNFNVGNDIKFNTFMCCFNDCSSQ